MSEPRKERKVVTVVFADLVGFTARAEAMDPEDVEAILTPYHRRLRAELERFGGTVEKFIGDAVMAVFGAPSAHEDDPERAVRAALAIRDWAVDDGNVVVRIAANTGEALVSLDARPQLGEGMVAGDVVNSAARLQTAAPENGVLVGESTHNATRDAIEYRETSPVVAKGKAEPLRVWEAVQARSRFGVDVRQTSPARLVGRERERNLLLDTFARVRSGRSPQLVTLIGVPGIGKSRLLYGLFESLEEGAGGEDLVTWRQGRCLPYGDGVSFWAISEVVKAHAGILEDDDSETAQAKLAAAVREVAPESDAAWMETLLRPLAGAELEAQNAVADRRDEAFAAWRQFFEALAEQRPLILVIEDLHWADDGLLDFIDHVADWSGAVPLLVLCTARPELFERRPGWGGGKLNALTLALAPLEDADAARLIAGVLDQAVLPAETQQTLLTRAGGNPLYAEQFARLYVERGTVEDLPLPENVQGLIAARLDTLPAEEKALLQDASVLGKVFWSGALSDDVTLRDRLHSLERKEFIRRERRSSVAGQDEYAFRHVLVRDVAYGQVPRVARGERHRAAAEWIAALGRPQDHAELIAHHYRCALELLRAGGADTTSLVEPARDSLREAGDRAFGLNSFHAAVGFYGAALELVGPGHVERPGLLFRLGRARFTAEEAGRKVLEEAVLALLAAGDRATAAEAETLLVELAWKRGDRETAFEHLDRANELVADEQSSRAKAYVLSTTSRYLMLAGESEDAVASGRTALAMAEELELDDIRAHALNNIGVSREALGDEGGIDDVETSIAIARGTNSPEIIRGYINLASLLSSAGRFPESKNASEEGLRIAEKLGHRGSIRWFRGSSAGRLYSLGNWDAALAAADAFIEEVERGSPHYLEVGNRDVRALIKLARDDASGAVDESSKAVALGRSRKDPQALYPALLVRARVLFELGERDSAEQLVLEFLRDVEGRIASMPYGGAPIVVWIVSDVGREHELRRLLGAAPNVRTRSFALGSTILDGEMVRAADMLREAGASTLEAFARLRAGKHLASQGRHADADAELGRALDFFRSVRATRYVREAEALLAATA